MNRVLLACCVLLICYLCVKSCARINAERDLGFMRDFSQTPGNESDLFDYICKSRYWTVEDGMNRIHAFSNKEGKANILPWDSSSSIILIFKGEPNMKVSNSSFESCNNSINSGCIALKDDQELTMSCITTLSLNEHENGISFSYKFKKNVIAYLYSVVQDIVTGSIDERLVSEKSLRVGFSSFGAEDISIIRGDAILGGNKMRGWINLGKRGPIHAKLYDAASGSRIGESKADRTNQYVGFDADPSKKFFFEIPLDVDGSGEVVDARIELYSGINDDLLFMTNALLQTWIR